MGGLEGAHYEMRGSNSPQNSEFGALSVSLGTALETCDLYCFGFRSRIWLVPIPPVILLIILHDRSG